jgi:hypothetical protein
VDILRWVYILRGIFSSVLRCRKNAQEKNPHRIHGKNEQAYFNLFFVYDTANVRRGMFIQFPCLYR